MDPFGIFSQNGRRDQSFLYQQCTVWDSFVNPGSNSVNFFAGKKWENPKMWMHFPFDYSFIMCLLKVKVNKNTLTQEVTECYIYILKKNCILGASYFSP